MEVGLAHLSFSELIFPLNNFGTGMIFWSVGYSEIDFWSKKRAVDVVFEFRKEWMAPLANVETVIDLMRFVADQRASNVNRLSTDSMIIYKYAKKNGKEFDYSKVLHEGNG